MHVGPLLEVVVVAVDKFLLVEAEEVKILLQVAQMHPANPCASFRHIEGQSRGLFLLLVVELSDEFVLLECEVEVEIGVLDF